MMRKLAPWLAAAAVGFPLLAQALGLGNISLSSALNEPLNARIDLTSVPEGESDGVKVDLAGNADFRKAGIDRPYLLTKLKFEVLQESGETWVNVTTQQPVREPFLNFLMEVNWSKGRLLREYTLLLDPPVYAAAASIGVKGPVVSSASNLDKAATSVRSKPALVKQQSGSSGTPSVSTPRFNGNTYGPTSQNDTLWSIASAARNADVTTQQMMLALLRSNPEAFINGNINALKSGYVLKIPESEQVNAIRRQEAFAEVKAQNEIWANNRGTYVKQQSVSANNTAGKSKANMPVDESEQARLKLLAPGTGDDGAGSSMAGSKNIKGMSKELAMAHEDKDVLQRENSDLKARLAEAEGLVTDLKHLMEMKDNSLAQLQSQLTRLNKKAGITEEAADMSSDTAEAESMQEKLNNIVENIASNEVANEDAGSESKEVSETDKEEISAATSDEAATEKTVITTPKIKKPDVIKKPTIIPKSKPKKESSLLDMLPIDPKLLGGILGAIVILIVGLFVVRKKKSAEKASDAASTGRDIESLDKELAAEEFDGASAPAEHEATEAMPEITEEDVAEAEATTVQVPGEDPLAEVNVYLAYERFDQAEEMLRKTIAEHPDNVVYQTKLLEIHYAAKNLSGFEKDAVRLQEMAGDDSEAMTQARSWWSEMSPDHELLKGERDESSKSLDSTLTNLKAGDIAEASAAIQNDEVDFDLELTSDSDDAADVDAVDFDLDIESSEDANLDLDLTSSDSESSEALDMDLTAGDDNASDELDINLGSSEDENEVSLDFDLTGDAEGPSTDETDSSEESAEGVDLDALTGKMDEEVDSSEELLDFDLDMDSDTDKPDMMETLADTGSLDMNFEEEASQESELSADTVKIDLSDETDAEGDGNEMDFDITGDDAMDLDIGAGDDSLELDSESSDDAMDLDIGAGDESLELDSESSEDVMDLDIGAGDDSLELDSESSEDAMDLDIGAGDDSLELDSESSEDAMDLDIGAGDDALELNAESSEDAMDLDIGAGDDALELDSESPDDAMDLDIGAGDDALELDSESSDDAIDLDISTDDTESVVDFDIDMDSDSDSEISLDLDSSDDDNILDLDATDGLESEDDPLAIDLDIGADDIPDDPDASIQLDVDSVEEGDLDFDLGVPLEETDKNDESIDLDLEESFSEENSEIDFELDDETSGEENSQVSEDLILDDAMDGDIDEMQTKLDLAQAYIEMGDNDGAKGILDEVMQEGNDEHKQKAQALLEKTD